MKMSKAVTSKFNTQAIEFWQERVHNVSAALPDARKAWRGAISSGDLPGAQKLTADVMKLEKQLKLDTAALKALDTAQAAIRAALDNAGILDD